VKVPLSLCLLIVVVSAGQSAADGDPERGAAAYRACVACHTLVPGQHASGPSLDGMIGRQAGTLAAFVRYTPDLTRSGIIWDAVSLDGWLANPAEMVPGTSMTFRGIEDDQVRADLIAFLTIAGQSGGGRKAVSDGLIPEQWLSAAIPRPIGKASAATRVINLRHCGDSYFVTTEDGRETPYWEKNLRLKIDSTETGPPKNVPVVLGSGMGGDRFSLVFDSIETLTAKLQEKC
jgi:cytochrome c